MTRAVGLIMATLMLWVLPSVMELTQRPDGATQLQIHGLWHEGRVTMDHGAVWLSAGFWRQGYAAESGHWLNITTDR